MTTANVSNLYLFPEGQIVLFALLFLRVIAFVVSMPLVGTELVPIVVKVLMAIGLTFLLFTIATTHLENPEKFRFSEDLILLSIREILIGLMMGYLMRMFFFSVSISGEIISVSSNFGAVDMFNPSLGSHGNVMEQFQLILATLIFLGIQGHHLFIEGLAKSLELLPLSKGTLEYKGILPIVYGFIDILLMGVKMSAPILISIFIANLSMAVLGRAVPQINVLMTSFSVTIGITICVLFISLPFYVEELSGLLTMMGSHFFKLLKVL